jgi:hypothetical protein
MNTMINFTSLYIVQSIKIIRRSIITGLKCANILTGKGKTDGINLSMTRHIIRTGSAFFFHPDFTVGTGISPVQSRVIGSRGLSPPVGNFTLPRRKFVQMNAANVN